MNNRFGVIAICFLLFSCNPNRESKTIKAKDDNNFIDTTIYPSELRYLGLEPNVEELSNDLRNCGEKNLPYWPKWNIGEFDFDGDGKKDRVYLLKRFKDGLNENANYYDLFFFKKKSLGYENSILIDSYDKPGLVKIDSMHLTVNFGTKILTYLFESNKWTKVDNALTQTNSAVNGNSDNLLRFSEIRGLLINNSDINDIEKYCGKPDDIYTVGDGKIYLFYNKAQLNGQTGTLLVFYSWTKHYIEIIEFHEPGSRIYLNKVRYMIAPK